MTEQWERDVDAAVRDLLVVEPMDAQVRANGRARLRDMIESEEPAKPTVPPVVLDQRRRRGAGPRWLAAAAAVVAVSAGGIAVVQSAGSDGPPGGTESVASAAQVLRRAAQNVDTAKLEPGQFRYVDTRIWASTQNLWDNGEPPFITMDETRYEVWTPAEYRQKWMMRWSVTGKFERLSGDEEYARTQGWVPPQRSVEEHRAPCGDFTPGENDEPCSNVLDHWPVGRDSAHSPWFEPDWIDSLPRDPEALLRDLRDDVERYGDDGDDRPADAAAFSAAITATSTGALPDDVQSALYRALALMPEIEVTEDEANLDGRKGTAIGIDNPDDRFEMIVDPDTGELIGQRQVVLDPTAWNGMPKGTVRHYTAVTTAVVDELGQRPGK